MRKGTIWGNFIWEEGKGEYRRSHVNCDGERRNGEKGKWERGIL